MIAILEKGKGDTAKNIFKGRVFDLFVFGENCLLAFFFLHKVVSLLDMVIRGENKNTRPIHTPDTDVFDVRINSPHLS